MTNLLGLTFATVGFSMLQQDGGGGGGGLVAIIQLVVAIIVIAGMWQVFSKAGQPGWAAIIPIYNVYIWTKIVGRPAWWILLLLIPLVNFIIAIMLYNDLSKSFGKGIGFTLGMLFLPFIFIPLLGFGDATYKGPVA